MKAIKKAWVVAAMLVVVGEVMGAGQGREAGGGVSLPRKNDSRYAALYSAKIEKLDIDNLTVGEICDRIKLPSRLRCSVVIRGKAQNMRTSLQFRGGSLKDFLDELTSKIPIAVSFNELSVVIESRADEPAK